MEKSSTTATSVRPEKDWLAPGASHRYNGYWAELASGQFVMFSDKSELQSFLVAYSHRVSLFGGPDV